MYLLAHEHFDEVTLMNRVRSRTKTPSFSFARVKKSCAPFEWVQTSPGVVVFWNLQVEVVFDDLNLTQKERKGVLSGIGRCSSE